MFRQIISVLLVLLSPPAIIAQSVEHVMFKQTDDDRLMVIYDLQGKPEDKFEIELWASVDGGQEFSFQPTAVTGEVGPGITPGMNKAIIWDVFSDMSKLEDDDLTFKVVARWKYQDIAVEIPKDRNNRALSKYNIGADWGDAWAVTTAVSGKLMTGVSAGWYDHVRTIGHADPPPLHSGGALYLHPLGRSTPAVIEGRFKINESGLNLGIYTTASKGFDWLLVILVDNNEIARFNVNGKTWHSCSMPLQKYKDKEINIKLCIYPTGWNREYAFISKIWFSDSSGKEIVAMTPKGP